MARLTQEELRTVSDPHGYSGHCTPDGTPLTNVEWYEEQQKWN